MQAEILDANPSSKIRIVGVNLAGQEAGNGLASAGRILPLLQDDPSTDAWTAWHAAWRDVIILDADNDAVGVFNLTDHNLSVRVEYDTLLDFLRATAGE